MANENGHITAPVNTDDVSSVLGVSSHDVRTLCRSGKINKDSLIRPIYTTNHALGPEGMKDAQGRGAPSVPADAPYLYERKSWGYYVPYVVALSATDQLCEIPWVRHEPDNDPALGDSFDCLTHFDGYRHNAKASLSVDALVFPGSNITLLMSPGKPQSNILSSDGKANNGGVVGIRPVFGDNVYIGCTIIRSPGSSQEVKYHVATTNKISDMLESIDTGIEALPGRIYKIIPWVTNGKPYYVNNTLQLASGGRVYSLKYYDEYEGFIEITCPSASVAITHVVYTQASNKLNFETTVEASGYTTAQTVAEFKLTAKYAIGKEKKEKTVVMGGNTAISIPSNSSRTIDLYTNDATILNNINSVYSLIISATWNGQTIESRELINKLPSLEVEY